MKSLAILRHSLLQVVRQPREVLQIFLAPLAATFLALKLAGLAYTLSPLYLQIAIVRGVLPWGKYIAVLIASYLVFVMAAAVWHRFILLAEKPRGLWPVVAWPVYWSFLRKSLWIGFLVLLVIVLASFVVGFVYGFASAMTKRSPGLITHALAIVLSVPVFILALRLSVNLPKAAVLSSEPLGATWQATAGHFWMFVALMLALSGLRYLSGALLSALELSPLTTGGFMLAAVLESLQLIFALSVATTLYGHLIEKRDLI